MIPLLIVLCLLSGCVTCPCPKPVYKKMSDCHKLQAQGYAISCIEDDRMKLIIPEMVGPKRGCMYSGVMSDGSGQRVIDKECADLINKWEADEKENNISACLCNGQWHTAVQGKTCHDICQTEYDPIKLEGGINE